MTLKASTYFESINHACKFDTRPPVHTFGYLFQKAPGQTLHFHWRVRGYKLTSCAECSHNDNLPMHISLGSGVVPKYTVTHRMVDGVGVFTASELSKRVAASCVGGGQQNRSEASPQQYISSWPLHLGQLNPLFQIPNRSVYPGHCS